MNDSTNTRHPTPDTRHADPLLRVRRLCKHFPIYGKGFLQKQVGLVRACDEVSFDIMPGETLGLVGESGCGKTTTARTILRALSPTSGDVFFMANGETIDLAQISEKELKPLRTQMGWQLPVGKTPADGRARKVCTPFVDTAQ